MSAVDKWSSLDYGRTAHWWVGHSGTACGRDFKQDLRRAYSDDPKCRECVAAIEEGIPA